MQPDHSNVECEGQHGLKVGPGGLPLMTWWTSPMKHPPVISKVISRSDSPRFNKPLAVLPTLLLENGTTSY